MKINATAQGDYLFETFNLAPDDFNPNADTEIRLYDSAGAQVARNTDRGKGPGGEQELLASRIVWHPAHDEEYRAEVLLETDVEKPASGEDTSYDLMLVDPLTGLAFERTPVDQSTWAPDNVTVPIVRRFGNWVAITQFFWYTPDQLERFREEPTRTLSFEIRRPLPDNDNGTGGIGNDDYLDYWQLGLYIPPSPWAFCDGYSITNLPAPTDAYSEESDREMRFLCSPLGMDIVQGDEEFEIWSDDPSALKPGKVYYVTAFFRVDDEDKNDDYRFYLTKAEFCKPFLGVDVMCNLLAFEEKGWKGLANLSEAYVQIGQ